MIDAKGVDRAWGLLKGQALSGGGSHSALIELASKMAGFQHWHEAAASRGPEGAASTVVRVEIGGPGPALGRGLGVDWGAMSAKASSDALAALALSCAAPPGWSVQAWEGRIKGLAELLPESAQALAALGQPCSIPEMSSWEGISRSRALLDKSSPQALGSRWLAWARPWHSTFAPADAESRQAYEPMRLAWGLVASLVEKSSQGASWRGALDAGVLRVDPGEHGAWIGLAKALLRSEGRQGELAGWEGLSPEQAAAGLARFPPAGQGSARVKGGL